MKPNAFLICLWVSSLAKPIPITASGDLIRCEWPIEATAKDINSLAYAIDCRWYELHRRNLTMQERREKKVLSRFISTKPDDKALPKVVASWTTVTNAPVKGVHFDAVKGKWRAVHKGRHLGWFRSKSLAIRRLEDEKA